MLRITANHRMYVRRMENHLRRYNVRWVSKLARFVRVSIRSKIRRRKKKSKPGQSPTSHTGWLKRSILYAVNKDDQTAVIGAKPFNNLKAARNLEKGGSGKLKSEGKIIVGMFRKRPFVEPGFKKGVKDFNKKQMARKLGRV